MPKPKGGLGKGLGALIGDAGLSTAEAGSVSLPISQVEPGLNQPRKRFDEEPAITRSSPGSAAGGRQSRPASGRCPWSSLRRTTAR